ncbi:MAG: prepilin peptidase [Nitrospinaceae bacterium]|nr:prepilin peptidase [Nitrospinaceae bacterium]NIR54602.1 prepilin peptidase [Nitrospinaceae bacterium]NIS85024.1 prepilin peptidase [Nitrospinaceae bacterium]NIT81835.1 prepilin peptidase [Nitrospinaceae bacterium]NIU44098.1 prepilin peptidase [Nitrospinaceae bacterium]
MVALITNLSPLSFSLIGLILGLVIGSFANVCIARIPRKESIAFPASHCPKCKKPIHATDNIPVLSYLILKGQCRNCGQKISAIYPAIELITGLLMAAVFYRFGFTWECLIFAIVIPTLVVITAIDIEHQIIPDVITLPGIIFGLAAGSYLVGFQDSLIGLLLGGGFFYLLAEGYFRVRGAMGMGGGDIKYIAAAGALLGWMQVLLVIFIGALAGGVFGGLGMGFKKLGFLSKIPFGPFLALATLISIFFGDQIVAWYLTTMVPRPA